MAVNAATDGVSGEMRRRAAALPDAVARIGSKFKFEIIVFGD